jgi:hypothetical protein
MGGQGWETDERAKGKKKNLSQHQYFYLNSHIPKFSNKGW